MAERADLGQHSGEISDSRTRPVGRVESESMVRLAVQNGGDEPAETSVWSRLDEGPYSIVVHATDEIVEEHRAGELPRQKGLGFGGIRRVRLGRGVRIDGESAFTEVDFVQRIGEWGVGFGDQRGVECRRDG